MTRPKPDPAAGIVVYGRSIALAEKRYDHPAARKVTENICRLTLTDHTGLEPVWDEWRFVPESTHRDEETGELVTLPALWVYTCEAPGPKGLAP